MNLRETQQLLSMLWSLYPNAPKLSREDKEMMAFAWLGMFYEYSLADVWKAVRKCFEHETRFVPTAPDVLKYCQKEYQIERYLPSEYAELRAELAKKLGGRTSNDVYNMIELFRRNKPENDEERKLLSDMLDARQILRRLDAVWDQAYEVAKNAYTRAEQAKLAEDGAIKKLKMLAIVD